MQNKEEIEKWYDVVDPWNYTTNKDDIDRKNRILTACGKAKRALDIGAGEGFITKDIDAHCVEAIELSDNAASRLPENIIAIDKAVGYYDLILATGIMYGYYDYRLFIEIIKKHSKGRVVLCNIKDWEVDVSELGTPVSILEFPYREYTQILRIYENIT